MIRVGMMNPMYMPKIRESLLKSFENEKIFKFLHIPVQSGSNRILNQMKRGHTANVFKDTVQKFQKKFDMFTISTDIIVGFPTESEDDFQQTLELIRDVRPDVINLSRFSPRPGTKAAKMKQLVVSEVKRRSKIVFELAKKISYERNQEWIGWKGKVLIDEMVDGTTKGRNFAYKPVVINEKASLGEEIQVEIIKATQHGLFGKTLS